MTVITTSLQKKLSEAKESGQLLGQLKLNESLARYTTWRIGGNSECFYQPKNEVDLQEVLQLLPENTHVNWIGLGSNLLVRDGGVTVGLLVVPDFMASRGLSIKGKTQSL